MTLEAKVDDLVKQSTENATALKILVGEVKEMRNDIKPLASCQTTINRLCAEHDVRGRDYEQTKHDVAAVKQVLLLKEDGTSILTGLIPATDIRDTTRRVDRHDTYFIIIGAALLIVATFLSGIGQSLIRALFGI